MQYKYFLKHAELLKHAIKHTVTVRIYLNILCARAHDHTHVVPQRMIVYIATKNSKNMQNRVFSVILFYQNICKKDTELDGLKKNV